MTKTKQQEILRALPPEKRAQVVRLAMKPTLGRVGKYRISRGPKNDYLKSDDPADIVSSIGPLSAVQAAAKPWWWASLAKRIAMIVGIAGCLFAVIFLFPRFSTTQETVSSPTETKFQTSGNQQEGHRDGIEPNALQTALLPIASVTLFDRPTIPCLVESDGHSYPKENRVSELFQPVEMVSDSPASAAINAMVPPAPASVEFPDAFSVWKLWKSISSAFPAGAAAISDRQDGRTEIISRSLKPWAEYGENVPAILPETWRQNWRSLYSTFFDHDLRGVANNSEIIPALEFGAVSSVSHSRYTDGREELIFESTTPDRLWVAVSVLLRGSWQPASRWEEPKWSIIRRGRTSVVLVAKATAERVEENVR